MLIMGLIIGFVAGVVVAIAAILAAGWVLNRAADITDPRHPREAEGLVSRDPARMIKQIGC